MNSNIGNAHTTNNIDLAKKKSNHVLLLTFVLHHVPNMETKPRKSIEIYKKDIKLKIFAFFQKHACVSGPLMLAIFFFPMSTKAHKTPKLMSSLFLGSGLDSFPINSSRETIKKKLKDFDIHTDSSLLRLPLTVFIQWEQLFMDKILQPPPNAHPPSIHINNMRFQLSTKQLYWAFPSFRFFNHKNETFAFEFDKVETWILSELQHVKKIDPNLQTLSMAFDQNRLILIKCTLLFTIGKGQHQLNQFKKHYGEPSGIKHINMHETTYSWASSPYALHVSIQRINPKQVAWSLSLENIQNTNVALKQNFQMAKKQVMLKWNKWKIQYKQNILTMLHKYPKHKLFFNHH